MDCEGLPTELPAAQQQILAQSKQLTDQSKQLGEQSSCIKDLRNQVAYLKEQLVLANIRRFGRSSERYVDPDDPQGRLFDEAALPEQEAPEETPEAQTVAEHKRRPRGKRAVLPDCLERVRVEHTLPDSALLGPDGEQYTKCAEVITEQLEVIPQQVRVIEHVRYQYAVKGREELGVKIAPMPKQPIPKSIASASLLAHVVQSKYCYHLPLYRQEQIWAELGVSIPRNSMCRWMQQLGELSQPLVEVMCARMKQHGHIHVDETPVKVLQEANKSPDKSSHQGYMWVYHNPFGTVFNYCSSRSGKHVQDVLGDYQGYVQTDRYAGYNTLFQAESGRMSVACMAHARRKFMDVIKASKKNKRGVAQHAIKQIKLLYDIERVAQEKPLSDEALLLLRKAQAIPILDKLKAYLLSVQPNIPPHSALYKAVRYFIGHFDALKRYTQSPLARIDNNPAERAIKPFAVGRKNWLFCGNTRGAHASANLYTLIESAKQYHLKLFDYLMYVFEKLPQVKTEQDLEQLMPILAQHHLPKTKSAPA